MNSIQNFQLTESMLDHVLDGYLTFDNDSIFSQTSLTNSIKAAIVFSAEAEANEIKNKIINGINGFPCSGRRRLDVMEIEQDGSQKILREQSSFDDLAAKILGFEGVQSAFAGYFPGRSEIAMDVVIYLEETFEVSGFQAALVSDFQAALTSVFGELGPAHAIFGAEGSTANVTALLEEAQVIVGFDLTLNTGFKIQGLKDFSTASTSDLALGSLFLRIEDLSVSAKASASGLSIDLFPGSSNSVGIADGSLFLSVGVKLLAPFESKLTASGDLVNGIGLSSTFTSQLTFKPFGELSASLPFTTNVNGVSPQSLTILFEDDDLFDDKMVLVKDDFDACQVNDLIQSLLGTLGSIQLSVESILGPSAFNGINFFGNNDNRVLSSLNNMSPDVGKVRLLFLFHQWL